MQTKALYSLHIFIDEDYKKDDFFHPCASIGRLQVLIGYVNTCLQRNFNSFCQEFQL